MFVQRLMRLDKLSEPRVQSVIKLQLEVKNFLLFSAIPVCLSSLFLLVLGFLRFCFLFFSCFFSC